MAKSFPFSPSRSYHLSTHFRETQNNGRGTDSEIELRVSLKNPYRSLFMAWRMTRPGDFEPGGPARSRHSSRSLNYSTHSRAPCGNSSPPTSPREHHPQLKEQWDTHGVPRNFASLNRIHRENKRRSTGPTICRGIESLWVISERKLRGYDAVQIAGRLTGYLRGISKEIFD